MFTGCQTNSEYLLYPRDLGEMVTATWLPSPMEQYIHKAELWEMGAGPAHMPWPPTILTKFLQILLNVCISICCNISHQSQETWMIAFDHFDQCNRCLSWWSFPQAPPYTTILKVLHTLIHVLLSMHKDFPHIVSVYIRLVRHNSTV